MKNILLILLGLILAVNVFASDCTYKLSYAQVKGKTNTSDMIIELMKEKGYSLAEESNENARFTLIAKSVWNKGSYIGKKLYQPAYSMGSASLIDNKTGEELQYKYRNSGRKLGFLGLGIAKNKQVSAHVLYAVKNLPNCGDL